MCHIIRPSKIKSYAFACDLSLILAGHTDLNFMTLANGHRSGHSSRFKGGLLGAVRTSNFTVVQNAPLPLTDGNDGILCKSHIGLLHSLREVRIPRGSIRDQHDLSRRMPLLDKRQRFRGRT